MDKEDNKKEKTLEQLSSEELVLKELTLKQKIGETIRIIKCMYPKDTELTNYKNILNDYVTEYELEFGKYKYYD